MEYGIAAGAEQFPLMVVVNVSYVCNAKCIHCVHTLHPSSREVVGKDIFVDPAVFRRLADECGEYNSLIRVTGSGEPLMHPEIVSLIEYAKKKGARVSMITNGALLTPERSDRLLACGIDGLEFSIDACTKETYEKVRVGLNFETLFENLAYLRKQRDTKGCRTRLIASFVEEEVNQHERAAAEFFWVPDKVDVFQHRVWLKYDKLADTQNRRNLMSEGREPCPYPFERINMDSQGNFHLCAFDIDHDTDYGNIMQNRLSEIWRCPEIEEVRRYLMAREFEKIPLCSRCTDWGCRSWTHNYWKLYSNAEAANK